MFGKCKTCKELKDQNEYLKKMIESLFLKLNMPAIKEPEPSVASILEEEHKDEKEHYGD